MIDLKNLRNAMRSDNPRGNSWLAGCLVFGISIAVFLYALQNVLVAEFVGIGAVLAVLFMLGAASQAERKPMSKVRMWVTTDTKKCQEVDSLQWTEEMGQEGSTIRVIPGTTFQTILGWGAHFTDAACWVISQMAEKAREALLFELVDPSQMDLTMNGFTIGASDYSPHDYTPFESAEPDPKLTKFSIAYDLEYKIPVLKQVLKANGQVRYVARPWTPASWMKPGKQIRGGNMNYNFMDPWGDSFVMFDMAYEAAGVPIYAITPQNEPDTDQNGSMPQTQLSIQQERDFVKDHLFPKLQKAGRKTLIWVHDHNFSTAGRPLSMFEDAGFLKCVGGLTWHPYEGDPKWMTWFRQKYPNIPQHITEGTAVIFAPDYLTDHTNWSGQLTTYSRCGVNSVCWWNMVLDPDGKPNIGPFGCGGLVTVNLKTNEVIRSGQYWGTAHFSRFVKRDAKRIDSQGEIEKVQHVAFINTDGTHALVLTNNGDACTVTVEVGYNTVNVALDKGSTTTLTWTA